MRRSTGFLALAFFLAVGAALAGPIEVYFAPKGGFAPINKNRRLRMPDGSLKSATLSNSLIRMILKTPPGGTIKICLYAMGDLNTLDVLIKVAKEKRIKVKLLLDACASWTKDLRRRIISSVKRAYAEVREHNEKLSKGQWKERIRFKFEIRQIFRGAFMDRGRVKTLRDGKMIYGTMHEKFGVFYTANSKIPYDSFNGSSNVSAGSDQIFAENRVFFWDQPTIARQFQEEFARLWNEYGTPVKGCGFPTSEMYVPAYPGPGDVRVVFNGEPITEDKYYRIDEEIDKLLRKVKWRGGTVDVAMFSFTHRDLGDALIRYAERKPNAKFRILLDQTMMEETPDRIAVMGPWFEEQAKKRRLQNFEVRYKWRSNAFGYDEEKKHVGLVHFRSLLLHHKLVIVNGTLMCTGSYNWSASAEERNFENVMIFEANYKGHKDVIDRFMAEYNVIWNATTKLGPVAEPIIGRPRVVTGPEGRRMSRRLIQVLKDEKARKIRDAMDRGKFLTRDELVEITGITGGSLDRRLRRLMNVGLVCHFEKDGVKGYAQSD